MVRNSKYFLVFSAMMVAVISVAQVGINTTNPQQSVHVAGSSSNVRIEGLSRANTNANLGSGSSTRVMVDGNGDLSLGSFRAQPIEILVDSNNYLQSGESSTNKIVQTGNAFGYNTAGVPSNLTSSIFTLTGNAIIEVNYSLSWSVTKGANRLNDSHARVVQTALYFREVIDPTDAYAGPAVINDVDGVPINGGPWCIELNPSGGVCEETGGLIAINGQFYTNGDSRNGAHKQFKNVGTDYVKLGPGTYVALFAAQLAVGDTSGTGSVFLYLGSGIDEVQIIAYYYD